MHDFGSFVIRSSRGLGSLIMRCRLVITALTLNQSSEPLDILLAFMTLLRYFNQRIRLSKDKK